MTYVCFYATYVHTYVSEIDGRNYDYYECKCSSQFHATFR
jgi:hypothetical protein